MTVYSNDPKNPRYQLKMTGQVEVLLAFAPDRVFFRNVAKGTIKTDVVGLQGEKAGQAKLSEPTSSKPDFKAELTTKDGKQALKVTFTAPDREGRHSAQVSVKTGLDKPAELKLHVMAQVTGDLVPDRNYAIFSPFKPDNPPKFTLQVSSLTKKPFKIKNVVDPTGAVRGVASKKDGGWNVELTLTKAAGTPRGKIQLHTDRTDQPKLLINSSVRGANPRVPPNIRKLGSQTKGRPALTPSGSKSKAGPIRLQLNPGNRKIRHSLKPIPAKGSSASPPPKQ